MDALEKEINAKKPPNLFTDFRHCFITIDAEWTAFLCKICDGIMHVDTGARHISSRMAGHLKTQKCIAIGKKRGFSVCDCIEQAKKEEEKNMGDDEEEEKKMGDDEEEEKNMGDDEEEEKKMGDDEEEEKKEDEDEEESQIDEEDINPVRVASKQLESGVVELEKYIALRKSSGRRSLVQEIERLSEANAKLQKQLAKTEQQLLDTRRVLEEKESLLSQGLHSRMEKIAEDLKDIETDENGNASDTEEQQFEEVVNVIDEKIYLAMAYLKNSGGEATEMSSPGL